MKNKAAEMMAQSAPVHKNRIPMNIQFFAGEGDGAGTGDGGNGGGTGGEGTTTKLSFDDFLKLEGNQAEFDRRIGKATNTAVKNAEEKWRVMTDDKVSEAEKLAKMNEAEKNAYFQQKREKELSDKEAAITKRELMAEAKNTLSDKGLPSELAEILVYTDADACNKSIAAVEKAFKAAVQAGVEERLKGDSPMRKAPPTEDDDVQKQIDSIIMGHLG